MTTVGRTKMGEQSLEEIISELDVVFRSSNTRREAHELTLEDANDDGKMDVVFDCNPFGQLGNPKPYKIVYEITKTGFRKIE